MGFDFSHGSSTKIVEGKGRTLETFSTILGGLDQNL